MSFDTSTKVFDKCFQKVSFIVWDRFNLEELIFRLSLSLSFSLTHSSSLFCFLFLSIALRTDRKEIFDDESSSRRIGKSISNRCSPPAPRRAGTGRKKQIGGKRFSWYISLRRVFPAFVHKRAANRSFIYSSRNSFVTRQTCKNTKIGIAFRNLVRSGSY